MGNCDVPQVTLDGFVVWTSLILVGQLFVPSCVAELVANGNASTVCVCLSYSCLQC